MFFPKNKYIYIFKTPLDSSYKNVYDSYSTKEDYVSFLLANFQYNSVLLSNDKSVRDIDGRFSIVFPNSDSYTFRDYNYMVSYDKNDKPVFSFVLSVDSNNDSKTAPACTFNCKLDVWSNHYLDFSDKPYKMKYSTADLNDTSNEYIYSKDLKAASYRPVSCDFLSKQLYTKGNEFDDDIRVLWARIGITPSHGGVVSRALVNGSPDWVATSHTYGCYNCDEGQVLSPIAIVKGNELVKNVYIGYANNLGEVMFNAYTGNYGIVRMWLTGDYITDASLTYFPSFEYTITKDTFGGDNNTRFIIKPKNNSVIYPYEVDTVNASFTTATIAGFSWQPVNPSTALEVQVPTYKRVLIRRYKMENTLIDISARYSVIFHNPIVFSYSAYRYPFCRTRVIYNGKSVVLDNDNHYDDIYAYLYFNGSLSPSISILQGSYNNNKNFAIKDIINNNGTFSIKSSNISIYLNRNTSRLIHGAITNAVGLVSNVATTAASMANPVGAVLGVGNVVNSFMRLTQPLAEMKDMANVPDQIKPTSINAMDDFYLQDDVAIVNEQGFSWNRQELEETFKMLHECGILFTRYITLSEIEHDVFDFVQSDNITLRENMDTNDKEELERALDRGIRKWHINALDSDTSTSRKTILKTMKTNCMNIPASLL